MLGQIDVLVTQNCANIFSSVEGVEEKKVCDGYYSREGFFGGAGQKHFSGHHVHHFVKRRSPKEMAHQSNSKRLCNRTCTVLLAKLHNLHTTNAAGKTNSLDECGDFLVGSFFDPLMCDWDRSRPHIGMSPRPNCLSKLGGSWGLPRRWAGGGGLAVPGGGSGSQVGGGVGWVGGNFDNSNPIPNAKIPQRKGSVAGLYKKQSGRQVSCCEMQTN